MLNENDEENRTIFWGETRKRSFDMKLTINKSKRRKISARFDKEKKIAAYKDTVHAFVFAKRKLFSVCSKRKIARKKLKHVEYVLNNYGFYV